jgi:NDP-4-keto-2,6-dideoxyhexose 3-C-methyltransferase
LAAVSDVYEAAYGYNSSLSTTMVSHLEWIVQQVVSVVDPKPGDIALDIGCNDGALLNLYEGRGLQRFGIDPASRKFAHLFHPDIVVVYDFFSEEKLQPLIAHESARIITSIAMFYEVQQPLSFMSQVRSLLRRDGVWALEVSYLPLMLTNLAYDQILHWHLLYLGLRQIQWMMNRSGLRLLDIAFNEVNGGSIFILAGRDDGPYPSQTTRISDALEAEAALETDAPYVRFRHRILAHRDDVRHFLILAEAAGKTVLGYGASTKGNIVLNYCGVDPELMPAVCDANPEKHGLVTPGSRIPVISKEEARRRKPDYFLVLIWPLRTEVLGEESDFIANGGTIAFDLPRLHFVNRESYQRYVSRPLSDLAYPL